VFKNVRIKLFQPSLRPEIDGSNPKGKLEGSVSPDQMYDNKMMIDRYCPVRSGSVDSQG